MKAKVEMLLDRLKDNSPGALPAVIILIMLVLTLILFNVIDRIDKPTIETGKKEAVEQTALIRIEKEPLYDLLNKMMDSTKTRPFKAKVHTEAGFIGYWTQNGDNYRFEDPSRTNVIIINASQKKLWVINLPAKSAHETAIDTSNQDNYNELIPTLLFEGLSATATNGAKVLEDILPGGSNSKLTLNRQGLPDRWDGARSNGAACFIDWDYVQVDNIPPSEFELPQGITINTSAP